MSEHRTDSMRVAPPETGGRALADVGADSEHRSVSPVQLLHRHLRGRYVWAGILALLGAVGGGYAGWFSQEPQYRADAIINIAASTPSPRDPRGQNILPMFRAFLELQVTMLESYRLTMGAIKSEAWRETGLGESPEAIESFIAHRTVTLSGDSHIGIQYVDENPDVALAGVRALLEAYDEFRIEENRKDAKLRQAEGQAADLEARQKELEARIFKLPAEFGGEEGLEIRHDASLKKVLDDEDFLRRVEAKIRRREATDPKAAGPEAPGSPFVPKSESELALEYPQLQAWRLDVELLEDRIELRAKRYGELDEQLTALRGELDVRKRMIARFVEDTNKRLKAEHDAPSGAADPGKETLEQLKLQQAGTQEHLDIVREEARKYGEARMELRRLRAERDTTARQLDEVKQWKEELKSQLEDSGRIQVLYRGDRPSSPFRDRRKVRGVAGGLLGSALGVFIVFLFGLRDSRLKSSGDIGTSLSRVRLLGLMPDLPGDLDDAHEGEIAAHCVHQVRTLLQISHCQDRGGAFCITGPSVGSGKTTLTLALGLSFARSGSKTLLVDADFSGRGLTWRVGEMLLSHVERLAGPRSVEVDPRSGGGPKGSAAPSLVARPLFDASMGEQRGAGELASLLVAAIERHGAQAVRESGLVSHLLALADLRFPGRGRAAVVARLAATLGPTSPPAEQLVLDWGDPPYRELGSEHQDFNGTPIERYMFRTGVPSLNFLPLRGLGPAGGISIETLDRILRRVREEFDVVLVDTGPVLGAVETSIVAAHTDAVVVVVSPEDRRPDAERAIAQLDAVGARIAGVVFNHADSADVLRSSRSHSVARSNGAGA